VTYSFIEACEVEPVTVEIAFKGGDLFRRYCTKGVTLTSLDCLIAATAMIKGYKVATRNVKHFPEKGILFEV
jgi:predicted nucleic acid-binding protein